MSQNKKKIAVMFGGRSPEHDVSVVTGLQILHAIDDEKYDVFPVYVSPQGQWRVGDVLRDRANYLLDEDLKSQTRLVVLDPTPGDRARLISSKSGLFKKPEAIEFDAALPCFHGLYGEDGNVQGLLEFAGIPYAGMRTLAASVLMDKVATKRIFAGTEIPQLPYAVIKRPEQGLLVSEEVLAEAMGGLKFPCIVKPSHLGSSIGVAKVNSLEELRGNLPAVFEFDDAAIVEPFVENLVEYNVAVSKAFGTLCLSAIERPKAQDELLDFKQKYLSGGDDKSGNKLGNKTSAPVSEGMLSLTRELNPKLPDGLASNIKRWAEIMFETVDGTGAPRIDFIGNSKTGELWLNEVNPWPGSIGYFLWEAAKQPVMFTDLLTALIEEAFKLNRQRALPKDPVPKDARLFQRRG